SSRRRGSRHPAHLGLDLLQPEGHLHLAVHRRRGDEVLAAVVLLAGAPVQLSEAKVAVGDDGARSNLRGQGHRMLIVGLRWRKMARGDRWLGATLVKPRRSLPKGPSSFGAGYRTCPATRFHAGHGRND